MLNANNTRLINAEKNSSYHANNKNIRQSMTTKNNNNRILYENASPILQNKNYYFEPIDHDMTTSTNNSHSIQRPTPIDNHHSNTMNERSKKSQIKRNSTINMNPMEIDSTIRSYTLPRSVTSDQIAKNSTTNRLYYYPSVQDVLDALNRRAFDKESFV